MTQKVRIHGEPSASHTDGVPLNIDSSGNLGVNLEAGSVSIGAVTNAVLTAVEDQTTHYLGTKDVALNAIISNSKLAVADSGVVSAIGSIPAFNGVVTNSILTEVANQRAYYIATAPAVASATLQSAATGTGTGTAMTVTGFKMLALSVVSTATSVTLDFEANVDTSNYMTGVAVTDIQGVDWVGSITLGAGTYIYQFMCAGLTQIQANITAITVGGGSVTVTAQAVA